jgi:hypothetical protein
MRLSSWKIYHKSGVGVNEVKESVCIILKLAILKTGPFGFSVWRCKVGQEHRQAPCKVTA